jgi:hypothetical protein
MSGLDRHNHICKLTYEEYCALKECSAIVKPGDTITLYENSVVRNNYRIVVMSPGKGEDE